MALILFIILLLTGFNIVLLLATGKKYINIEKKLIRGFLGRVFLSLFFATITVIAVPILKNNSFFKSYAFIYTIIALFIMFSLLLTSSFAFFCIKCLRKTDDMPKGFATVWKILSRDIKLCSEDKENGYFKRMFYLLFPLLGILYMVFFFGIFETYTANYNEFCFAFETVIGPMFLISVIVFLALIFIVPLLKGRDFKITVISFSSLFLFMYIQNAFFDDKSVMLGNYVAPSFMKVFINDIIFIAFVLGPIIVYYYLNNEKKRNYLFKGSVFASVFLLLIQVAPLPFLVSGLKTISRENPKNGIRKEYVLSGEDEFVVSKNKNIVVFILDTYNSDSFEEMILLNPLIKEELNDFIYFDNMSTMALNTGFSMPYLLTCQDVDFKVSLEESNANAWNSGNANYFYSSIHDDGYIINLFTDSDDYCGDADNMLGKIDNVKEVNLSVITDSYKTYLKLLKLSFYKYSPLFIKSFFFVSGSEEINSSSDFFYNGYRTLDSSDYISQADYVKNFDVYTYNYDFYNRLLEGLHTDDSNYNRLNIYHLFGLHAPYYALTSDRLVTVDEEEKICFVMVSEYINQLKKLGLYDDSTIIITADHGIHGDILHSDPVMLIKKSGYRSDEMMNSSVPGVIQLDLLPTILYCSGIDDAPITNGNSLFELDCTERERITRNPVYTFEFRDVPKCNGVGSSSINAYIEYRYKGRVDDIDLEKDYYDTEPIFDFWF